MCSAGAHPALTDVNGWIPLHYACDNGHLECARLLLHAPNYLGLSGLRPAVDIAQGNGFTDMVALLKEGIEK